MFKDLCDLTSDPECTEATDSETCHQRTEEKTMSRQRVQHASGCEQQVSKPSCTTGSWVSTWRTAGSGKGNNLGTPLVGACQGRPLLRHSAVGTLLSHVIVQWLRLPLCCAVHLLTSTPTVFLVYVSARMWLGNACSDADWELCVCTEVN